MSFIFKKIRTLASWHSIYLFSITIAVMILFGFSFFLPSIIKMEVGQQSMIPQFKVKSKKFAVTPKPTPSTTPQTTPKPQPPTQPEVQQSPKVQVANTPPPTPPPVTPAPNSSVPSLQPATSSSPTGSTSTGTGSTGSDTNSNSSTTSISYTSSNWSGYFSSTSTYKYTAVSGDWTEDTPTGNGSSNSYDATWIGVGGITTNDLIQVGINNTVSSTGQISTQAFYEMLPSPSVTVSGFKVSPGDSITASITETSTDMWSITLNDLTQNETFNKVVSYTSSLSSAEWIEEDPSSIKGGLLPLDNFGTVKFGKAFTIVNGTSSNLLQINANSVTMVNSSGKPEAVPSAIGNDGASFSVQWQ